MRIGNGYDVHRLVKGRDLILGGVKIDHEMGLEGHSDADVLVHAIMDAILGAAGMGDIGLHFPDNDDTYKDASSMMLLENVMEKLENKNYKVVNIDATIIAQKPKLRPYIKAMEENVASVLHCDISYVNIKATTEEHLGFTGREEGISACCVCLIE